LSARLGGGAICRRVRHQAYPLTLANKRNKFADHAQPATLAAFVSLAICVRYPREPE